jgi:hypothetical protein
MCKWLFQNPAVTTKLGQSRTVTALANRGTFMLALGSMARTRPLCTRMVPSSIGGSVGEG